MLTSPWMIEELRRNRRERESHERPVLHVELPEEPRLRREPEARPTPRGVIVIEL